MRVQFIILISTFPICIFAQNKTYKLTSDILFSKNYISISFISNLTQKAKIQRTVGNAVLYSRPNFGFEAGFNYTFNFSKYHTLNIIKNYGITTGIHIGVVLYDVRFHLSKDEFILPWDSDFELSTTEYAVVYYSYPVLFEFSKELAPALFMISKIGLNIRYYPTGTAETRFSYHVDSVSVINVFRLNLDVDLENKPILNYNLSIGILKVFKNYGALKFNIIYNLSFTEVIKGHYYFTNIGNYTEGTYSINGNYLGIELEYIFTKF